MEFFVNILTLTACFATMAYCYVLAKRIHSFRNMKDGMGALIEEMIRTTTDLQTAFNATQHNIDTQCHKIQDKIDEGIALSDYLTGIMNDIEESSHYLHKIQTEISSLEQMHQKNATKAPQYYYSQPKPQAPVVKHSTLPDAFQIAKQQQTDLNHEQEDPFSDVVPVDFDSLKRKKRPKIIIPGEEYL